MATRRRSATFPPLSGAQACDVKDLVFYGLAREDFGAVFKYLMLTEIAGASGQDQRARHDAEAEPSPKRSPAWPLSRGVRSTFSRSWLFVIDYHAVTVT
ncbi:MAG TPA: hypothetical protein VFQ44_20765 [Streptosporangiaceae bacterium]|nr:hypothetical protein [Streptosporangiaceae bacterium]